jgi:hypothetical protein
MVRQWFVRPVVDGVEARQGFLDRPVLAVLCVSCALVIIVFVISYSVS